jgi:hypothetical protein
MGNTFHCSIGQRPLQRFRFPWRAKPDVMLLPGCQNYRHGLGVNRRDDGEKEASERQAGSGIFDDAQVLFRC